MLQLNVKYFRRNDEVIKDKNLGEKTPMYNDFLKANFLFPSLEELNIQGSTMYNKLVECDIPNPISATPSPHFSPFPNLRDLSIWDANNMNIGIGSPSIAATLVHLETLQIWDCKKMKVISEETEEETQISSNIIITFPKLHFLMLGNLDQLECIYGGSYKVEFPTLKKMELGNVHNMTRFVGPGNTDNGLLEKVEFPSLEELTLSKEPPNMMNLYSSLKTLRVLNLLFMKWKHAFSKDMMATIGLTQLHHLEIRYCFNMEAVVASSSFNLQFPRLTTIHLESCDKMRCFFSTRNAQIILNMPSLQEVSISECNDMELFSNGTIKVPKLAKVNVRRSFGGEVFEMPDGGDLNEFIQDLYKSFHP